MNKISTNLNKTGRDLDNCFLLFQLTKDDETRKTKQNNKTAILEKLVESIMSEEVDSEGIEDFSRNVGSPDDDTKLVGKIERIMKSKKYNILILAYHQGLIFKTFKGNNKFTGAVANLKIGKATINFKIGGLLTTIPRCENLQFLFIF